MNSDPIIPAPVKIPFPLWKLLGRLGIWLLLSVVILFGVLVWWCASEIAEPPRRQVSEVQQQLLDGAIAAGFKVEEFMSADGMPCFVCTPQPTGKLSQRGAIIRGQLEAKGVELKPQGEIIGTLMLLHGRAGMKEDYLAVAERFCAVGFRCVIPDLPGHGVNAKRFTTYGVLEAPMILKCYEEAAAEFGFVEQPCAILGQSMGGAAAIHTATLDGSPFAAMVVISSFDKLDTVIVSQTDGMLGPLLGNPARRVADRVYGWKTGVRVSEIDSAKKAAQLRIPTLMVHGEADTTVPTACGKVLYESIPAGVTKEWLVVPGAGHSNVLVTDFPLYATMAKWFLDHLNPPPAG